MKKIIMVSLILAAILLSSGPAFAWRFGIVPPPLWVGPPGFYYPGYYPPPVYYGPGYYSSPYRVWVPGHLALREIPEIISVSPKCPLKHASGLVLYRESTSNGERKST